MATTSDEQEKLTSDPISHDRDKLNKALALEFDYQVPPDFDLPQPTHDNDWHDILAHYMKQAGHKFSCLSKGSFSCGPHLYQVGTMTIDNEEHVYWIRSKSGDATRIGVQHYGDIICEESGLLPTLSKDCDGPVYLSAADPRIFYTHPDTKKQLSFLEWCNARRAHFNFMKEDTRMLNSLPAWLTTWVLDVSEKDQSTDQVGKTQDLRDAVGIWGRPEIKLRDGFSLDWTYVRKSNVWKKDHLKSNLLYAEDLVRFFFTKSG